MTTPRNGPVRIAVEEGFSIPEIQSAVRALRDAAGTANSRPPTPKLIAMFKTLCDLGETRLKAMDDSGTTMQLILLSAPGVQIFDAVQGTELAALANDRLAAAIRLHPTRFAGLAAIAPQDPEKAATELERGVKSLGLKGAVINSHTHGEFLDDRKFWKIFEAAAALKVPIYIHPREPAPQMAAPLDVDGLRVGWGYGVEVGTHILRLVASGVFDTFPDLRIVIGHMGEGIPFVLGRLDNRWRWEFDLMNKLPSAKKLPSEYIRSNIVVTTSGANFKDPLLMTIAALGADNILFAADYPFEDAAAAIETFDAIPMSDTDREKIYHLNAKRVFSL